MCVCVCPAPTHLSHVSDNTNWPTVFPWLMTLLHPFIFFSLSLILHTNLSNVTRCPQFLFHSLYITQNASPIQSILSLLYLIHQIPITPHRSSLINYSSSLPHHPSILLTPHHLFSPPSYSLIHPLLLFLCMVRYILDSRACFSPSRLDMIKRTGYSQWGRAGSL